MTENLRAIATRVLLDIQENQRSLTAVLPYYQEQVKPEDRALLQELSFGTCRWFQRLDFIQASLLHRPLRKRDNAARILINLGLYQLLFTRIPAHAAIHSTVDAAPDLGMKHLKGLINGLLRQAQRDQEGLQSDTSASVEVQFSHPDWIVQKLKANWPDHYQEILQANNERPPLTLRINTGLTRRETFLEQLQAQGIDAVATQFSPTGVTLTTPCDVKMLPGFQDGWFTVQDEAAQLCTTLLDLKPGQRVLDACAAPGGKTCAIRLTEPNLAQLVAVEKDPQRAERINENLERLNIHADVIAADATDTATWWDGQAFDRILLDAPCSATGVIRRHPDIKLLRREQDIAELAKLQLHLLEAVWPTLKANGILVYATCSVFPQENTRIIERFQAKMNDVDVIPLEPEQYPWGINTTVGKQLLPQSNSHDGFFYACLRKH